MYDLITIGDIKLDTFVVLENASVQCSLKMPECLLCLAYGEKIPVDLVDSQVAGSAPNVARGLARMKFKTAVVSVMGADGTRKLALHALNEEKVDTRYIKSIKSVQSSFSVVLNYKGDRTILASHIDHIYHLPLAARTKWLYVSELGNNYDHLFKEVAQFCRQKKAILGFNPGAIQINQRKPSLYTLIKQATVLFANLEEAQAISGEKSREIHVLLPALKRLGPKIVVITDGREGAYSYDGKESFYCPIFPSKFLEATGAGDAFATGYIGALMSGENHDEALRWGAVNAASVVTFVGPTRGLLPAHIIRARLKKNKTFTTMKV